MIPDVQRAGETLIKIVFYANLIFLILSFLVSSRIITIPLLTFNVLVLLLRKSILKRLNFN